MAGGRGQDRAALGFSVHTGWAALVALSAGSPAVASIEILDRRTVQMIPGSDPEGPRFVYHAAAKLSPAAAERFVRESAERAASAATEALRAAAAELSARGHRAVAAGVVVGDGRPAPALDAILRSHALIHAAEGVLFRRAIRRASEALELRVAEIRAKELPARAAAALGIAPAKLAERLSGIGRAAGRPWAKDQRDACLAACVALLS
jgi:hypothetical protein